MSGENEERQCKTCHWWRSSANYCASFDASMAEWDSCNAHETYDEMLERVKRVNKHCGTHGLFLKDYNYCPYCGSELIPPTEEDITHE